MCGLGCNGGKSSSMKGNSGYTPKSRSASKGTGMPKGWATGGSGKQSSNNYGTPKIRASFGGRKY